MTAPLEPPLYQIRIEIPRLSGTRGWSAAASAFEKGLAAQASLLVTERQIELVTRQGRDYVRVSATVEAAHVAEAAVLAWGMLQQAMGEDVGWDTAGASAEIRPARSARKARLPKPFRLRTGPRCARCPRSPAAARSPRLSPRAVAARGRGTSHIQRAAPGPR
jgi:hypothetical protein